DHGSLLSVGHLRPAALRRSNSLRSCLRLDPGSQQGARHSNGAGSLFGSGNGLRAAIFLSLRSAAKPLALNQRISVVTGSYLQITRLPNRVHSTCCLAL